MDIFRQHVMKRMVEIKAEHAVVDSAMPSATSSMTDGAISEGGQRNAIHKASEDGVPAATQVKVEKQFESLSFAVSKCFGEDDFADAVAKLTGAMESQQAHTYKKLFARLDALESVCFGRSQKLETSQDVPGRVGNRENEAAFSPSQKDTQNVQNEDSPSMVEVQLNQSGAGFEDRIRDQIAVLDARLVNLEKSGPLQLDAARAHLGESSQRGNDMQNLDDIWKELAEMRKWQIEADACRTSDQKATKETLSYQQEELKMQRQALDELNSKMQEPPKLQQERTDERGDKQLQERQDDATVEADEGSEAMESEHTSQNMKEPGQQTSARSLQTPLSGLMLEGTHSLEATITCVRHMWIKRSSYDYVHTIAPTVWEMSIVMGTDVLSFWRSMRLCVVCILLLFLDAVFVITVATLSGWSWSLPESRTKFLDVLRQWRYTVAHDISHVSGSAQESLASRVCRLDELLDGYQPMTELVAMIDDCTSTSLTPLVAAAVLFTWYCCCMEDMLKASHFMSAVLNMQTDKKTKIRRAGHSVSSSEDEALDAFIHKPLELQTISPLRKMAICFLTFSRLAMAVCMMFFGGFWLSQTRDIADLLLNGIALSFVFEVDERVFHLMTPMAIHAIQQNLSPLLKPFSKFQYGVIFEHIASSSAALIIFLYMLTFHVVGSLEDLAAQKEALCGGQLDFAVALNGASKMILAAQTRSSEEIEALLWPNAASREAHVVETLVKSSGLCLDSNCLRVDTLSRMRVGADMPILDLMAYAFGQFNRTCDDQLDKMPANILTTLQYHNSNPSATTCDGLKDNCFEHEQNLLRFICPATCGAVSPYSGQILLDPEFGLFRNSCRESQAYLSSLAALPCTDLSREELSRLPGWSRAWQSFLQLVRDSVAEDLCAKEVANLFLSDGCEALSNSDMYRTQRLSECSHRFSQTTIVRDLFCTDRSLIPNLAVFCPVACGCKLTYNAACTPACQ